MQLPDARGWISVALVALTFYVLTLLAFVPALSTNEIFKTLATLIVGTGLIGGVVAFFFATTKGSADKDATLAKQLDKSP